ncbi:MAG: pilus assembly protein [Bacteroidales bacterium]|nr:pilus assembly protein [Bacteroidales bacterium]
MDVIVDSSVWFEYFKGNEPFFSEVQKYLNCLSVRIIDPVIGEILQGAKNKSEFEFIKTNIQYVPKIVMDNLFEKAGEYSFENKLLSKGIGLIDASLIYATIQTDSVLWTLDKKISTFWMKSSNTILKTPGKTHTENGFQPGCLPT